MKVYVTDKFSLKMLPYTEGNVRIERSSPVDVKRAILNGAETYIYNEETVEWLKDFFKDIQLDVETTDRPLLISRDEPSVIYVMLHYGEKKLYFVWRLLYVPDGLP